MTWVDTVARRGYGTELACVRRTRPAKSRFIFWILIALATIALGAGGVKLFDTFELRSLFADAPTVPAGVSDFGRPLPENHPFLQDSERAQGIIDSAAAALTTPASSSEAPLSLRKDCAWGEPGRNPYSGSVRQALKAARLPVEVVTLLERKIRNHETTDRLEIRNDKIPGVQSSAAFEPRAIKMTYGKTLCLNSRVNFKRGHVERADLYEVVDAGGTTYSVMVPYVCGNISVLGPREHAEMAHGALPPSRGGGGQGSYRSVPFTTPFDGNTVPEPGTWTLMVGGIALLGWLIRPR